MPQTAGYEEKRVLITVRTYPTPARRGVEVSCSAGITDRGEWIRLHPVPYRFLSWDKRFAKYQWIKVMARPSSDPRPESHEVDIDSIEILGERLPTDKKWFERKKLIMPHASPSLCYLQEHRPDTKQTLGIFKPKEILDFVIAQDTPDWTPDEKNKLLRYSLFQQSAKFAPLEKVPYKFFYRFVCDDRSCTGHALSCVDWELGQAFRSWRAKYGGHWPAKLRDKFQYDMARKFDTHFFVGTVKAHPASWIIVGLFYPPR
jgi:hypothetical protein